MKWIIILVLLLSGTLSTFLIQTQLLESDQEHLFNLTQFFNWTAEDSRGIIPFPGTAFTCPIPFGRFRYFLCEYYYLCFFGYPFLIKCHPQKKFDLRIKRCVVWSEAYCRDMSLPPPTGPVVPLPPLPPGEPPVIPPLPAITQPILTPPGVQSVPGGMPQISQISHISQIPPMAHIPQIPPISSIPGILGVPQVPTISGIPMLPQRGSKIVISSSSSSSSAENRGPIDQNDSSLASSKSM